MDQFPALYTTVLPMIQIEFVLSLHPGFPAFTIGWATWPGVFEGLWLKTGRGRCSDLWQLHLAAARLAELHREQLLGIRGRVDGVGHV